MNSSSKSLLILGAGVNGIAIAREMLLNHVSVVVVDRADVASGASAYNSRLIHGGLRYLEYREFDLVHESLEERDRLLAYAAHLVKPLRLFIPCENRLGGLVSAGKRFLGLPARNSQRSRGWYLVRMGLALYDHYAKARKLPGSSSRKVGSKKCAPPVDAARYRWFCDYYDGQVQYPERLVLALLADCRRIAAEKQLECELLTYHQATRHGDRFELTPLEPAGHAKPAASVRQLHPAAVVNATGASVDAALQQIDIASKRLLGGTKGSHLITRHEPLRAALEAGGVYAEAADGRPIFLLPWGESVLIGTTDVPFEGDPATAVASQEEIDYLIDSVNQIFPQVNLTASEVDQHYCGVRPLPYVDAASPSAITRRHWLHRHAQVSPPLFSVIGGKLTTCRQLAEDVAQQMLPAINLPVAANSRQRPVPGNPVGGESAEDWGKARGLHAEHVRRIWELCGAQAEELTLADPADGPSTDAPATEADTLPRYPFPTGFVRGVIRQEQPRHLADLVERRLMLVYDPRLSVGQLQWLAALLVEEGVLAEAQVEPEIAACIQRLQQAFGKTMLSHESRQSRSAAED